MTIEENLPDVDAVVITLVDVFDKVRDMLSKRLSCPVIAIEDIINEI